MWDMRWISRYSCGAWVLKFTGGSSTVARNVRAVWEGSGPARSRAHTEYSLGPEGDGTRFDYRNEFRAPLGPLGAIVSRALVGGMPEREATRTLERLRTHLESSSQAGAREGISVR